jgi:hypothetical protein
MRESSSFVELVRGRIERYGIHLSVAELDSVDLPAFAGTVSLRYAEPAPSGSAP